MDNASERPPYPGQDANGTSQTGQQPDMQPTQVSQPPLEGGVPRAAGPAHGGTDKGKGDHRTAKTIVISVVAGVIGAGALVFGLKTAGVIGGTQVIKTSTSSAGQTISIDADTKDATVSQAVAAKALPSVVSVYVTTSDGEGLGSGVILDKNGNIITNNHVVENAKSISVTIGGKSYDATLVGTDASSDLAVIHVDLGDTEVSPIEVGDSDALVVGDWVMSIGSPFGLDQSVSSGIVSALTRNQLMESSSGATLYTNLIQVDAAINPGNSGGALVDSEGKLVGICTLYSSDTESFAGIGFAIPGNYAIEVANKIVSGQTVTHAYIGLSMQTVNAQNAASNDLSVNQGAYVVSVTDGSPADQAGIKTGDIITAVNGEAITSADGMILNVRSHEIGETVAVTFMRGSKESTVSVTLGSDEALQQEQKSKSNSDADSGSSSDSSTNDLYKYFEELYNQRMNQRDTTGSGNNYVYGDRGSTSSSS